MPTLGQKLLLSMASWRLHPGFSEPLFVYNASPGLFGFQVANRIGNYLAGMSSLAQVKSDLEADFKSIEALYDTGAMAADPDAMLIWMGARMNWRGLALD